MFITSPTSPTRRPNNNNNNNKAIKYENKMIKQLE